MSSFVSVNLIQDTCYPQLEWSKEQLNEFISKNFKDEGYSDKERPFVIAKRSIDEFRKKIQKNIKQRFNETSLSVLPRYISRHEIRAEVIGSMDHDYMYTNNDENDAHNPYHLPFEPFSDLLEYMLTTLMIAWPNYASLAHQAELNADMFRYYLQSKELQFYRVWMDRHRKSAAVIFQVSDDAFADITERLTASAQEYFRKRDKNLRKFEIMTEGSDVKIEDNRVLTQEDRHIKPI